nr:hypothetical protein [Tanacetum cinerariifolium]
MSTNRPIRNKKPSTRLEDFVCSNKNEKNVRCSTGKEGKSKEVEGVVGSCYKIGTKEVIQESETEEVNDGCNNGGKVNTEGMNPDVFPKVHGDN